MVKIALKGHRELISSCVALLNFLIKSEDEQKENLFSVRKNAMSISNATENEFICFIDLWIQLNIGMA